MKKDSITLVAAVLAAVTSVGNAYFNFLGQSALERERREYTRKIEITKNLRNAVVSFSIELTTAIQHTAWLLWIVRFDSEKFSITDIEHYDKKMIQLLPRLLSSRILVASHNTKIYEQLTKIANRFYELDARIGLASKKFRASKKDGLIELNKLATESTSLHINIGNDLADILSNNSTMDNQ